MNSDNEEYITKKQQTNTKTKIKVVKTVTPPSTRYSFANQYLNQYKKLQIFTENEQILKYYQKSYDINIKEIQNMTSLQITKGGEKQLLQSQEKSLRVYDDILRMGYKISSIPINQTKYNKWRKTQRTVYSLVPEKSPLTDYNQIPRDTKIIFDKANRRLRLQGPNTGPFGYGPWVNLDTQTRAPRTIQQLDPLNDPYGSERELLKTILPYNKQQIQRIRIKEMPLIITDYGSIICLPFDRNEPDIGLCGQRGSGKSFFGHSLTDHAYWKLGRKIAIMNDYQRECGLWCTPWDQDSEFTYLLKNVGETPLPLPAVYLHPTNENKNSIVSNAGESGYQISFPYEELITNFHFFSQGKKEWEMGKSAKYFNDIKPALLSCKNPEEIQGIIGAGIAEDKSMVTDKLKSIMKDIMDRNILDITSQKPAWWTIKNPATNWEKKYNPITACLVADLVPILVTPDIYNKDYFPQLFRYYANDIFTKQVEDEYFIKNDFKIWLFVDEITSIDMKRKPTVASETLGKIVAEGRPRRLGFLYATQNPEKIGDRIATNTTYLFAFRFTNRGQATAIQNNFDLAAHRGNDILQLKPREILACTSQKFIEYDQQGRRNIIMNDAVSGLSIPSLGVHKPPSAADA